MNQEEQRKKADQVATDAPTKEVISANPTELSDETLEQVAGGTYSGTTTVNAGTLGLQTAAPSGTTTIVIHK